MGEGHREGHRVNGVGAEGGAYDHWGRGAGCMGEGTECMAEGHRVHGGGAEGAWQRGTECMGEGQRVHGGGAQSAWGRGTGCMGERHRVHGGGAQGARGGAHVKTLKIEHTTASPRSSQESGRVELCIFQVGE